LRRAGWARTVQRSGAAVAERRTAEGKLFCLAMQSRPAFAPRTFLWRGAVGSGKQLAEAVAGPGGPPPLDRPL